MLEQSTLKRKSNSIRLISSDNGQKPDRVFFLTSFHGISVGHANTAGAGSLQKKEARRETYIRLPNRLPYSVPGRELVFTKRTKFCYTTY